MVTPFPYVEIASMGFIPEGAEWFIADIVTLTTIEGEPTSEIELALVLVHARSADEAYQNAVSLGEQRQITYTNTAGNTVSVNI